MGEDGDRGGTTRPGKNKGIKSVDQARTSRRRAKSPVLGARGEARPGGNKGESNIV